MVTVDNRRLQLVAAFAADAHRGQERFPGVPYIVHPFVVMSSVLKHAEDFGGNLQIAAETALLHDTREDNPLVTRQKIVEVTGSELVADAVDALTKDRAIAGKQSQLEDSLRRCLLIGPWVLGVKGLDREDNWNPGTVPPHWKPAWRLDYLKEGQVVVDALARNGPAGVYQSLLTSMERYRECAVLS